MLLLSDIDKTGPSGIVLTKKYLMDLLFREHLLHSLCRARTMGMSVIIEIDHAAGLHPGRQRAGAISYGPVEITVDMGERYGRQIEIGQDVLHLAFMKFDPGQEPVLIKIIHQRVQLHI